jgi:hypothetical protein
LNSHYQGDIQPIEYCQLALTVEEFRGSCKKDIIKYVSRCGKKDDPIKEIKKVIDYAFWLLQSYQGKMIDARNTPWRDLTD